MLTIGLTGGIACGKTTVAQFFAELNITIIDADLIAREVVKPGEPALQAIQQHFGDNIVNNQGELNRDKLRQKIFAEEATKRWLEQLLHPLIRQRMQAQIFEARSPYCIVVIPLLIENLPHPLVDRILVVDCDEQQQRQRLIQRDQISASLADTILKQQAQRQQRLQCADDIIHNRGDLIALEQKTLRLHQKFLTMAKHA